MAGDPDRIQHEIDETREQLARTIDAIADRVSPKRAAARSADKVKTRVGSVSRSLHHMRGSGTEADATVNGAAAGLTPPAGGLAGSVDRGFGDAATPSGDWLGEPSPPAYQPSSVADRLPVPPAVLGGVAAAVAALAAWLILRRRRR